MTPNFIQLSSDQLLDLSGAQDWFTLLSFDVPDMIYPLDCKFNRQLSTNYKKAPWTEIFSSYYSCHGRDSFDPENTFIAHLNGENTNLANALMEPYLEASLEK